MTDREKVKERVRNAFANAAWHHALDPCEYVAEMLADELTFAKDTNVHSKWIPVTERLPEIGKQVLCHDKHGVIFMGAYLGAEYKKGVSCFRDTARAYGRGTTHWMPLPPPPKEET